MWLCADSEQYYTHTHTSGELGDLVHPLCVLGAIRRNARESTCALRWRSRVGWAVANGSRVRNSVVGVGYVITGSKHDTPAMVPWFTSSGMLWSITHTHTHTQTYANVVITHARNPVQVDFNDHDFVREAHFCMYVSAVVVALSAAKSMLYD